MIHPVNGNIETKENPLKLAAMKTGLGDPGEKILNAIGIASKQTGLKETFILALMFSESSFKTHAVSKKQYKGLMQIPHAVYYEDANVLIGSRIFTEKLFLAKGDYRKAIVLYKGWSSDHPEGWRQADKVLHISKRLEAHV